MKQLLIAHRGYSAEYPENTQLAFDKAVEYKFDGVEIDVHLCKTGEAVIIHDEMINRTSDMQGVVRDMTLEELRKANFAHGTEFKEKQTIMTLDEFFDRYQKSLGWFNIELKTDMYKYKGIEKIVNDLIIKYNLVDKTSISSFHFNTLKRFKKVNPDIPLAFLWETKKQWKKVSDEEKKEICTYLNPHFMIYKYDVKYFDSLGMKYNVWTINTEKETRNIKMHNKIVSRISNGAFH